MKQCVVASLNPGKLAELKVLLSDLPWEFTSMQELNITEVEETGKTFIENALIKARHAAQQAQLPAIADDSGLEVLALHNAPGIYSARYAGEHASADENIAKLLDALKDVEDDARQARFICVAVYLAHVDDPTPIVCQGSWQGTILREPIGEIGFGYDPIFWVPEYQCSVAQLEPKIKNKLSHRGKALQRLLKEIKQDIKCSTRHR